MNYTIAAVVKVTDQCNLSCPYCYYYAGSAQELRKRKFSDSAARLEMLADELVLSTYFNDARKIMIVLHGGEPLLIAQPSLETFARRLRDHFGKKLGLSLQTNGVLVDDDWVDFFARHDIVVGVSLDGPKATHDRNRPFANGAGSYDAAVSAIQRLQLAADTDRLKPPGVLTVFSPDISGEIYFKEIIDGLGVKSFDLLFPDDAYASPDTLAAVIAAFSSATRQIWSLWLERDDPSIQIRFIQQALHATARNRPMNNPDVNRAVVIDLKGDMFVEDGLRASVDYAKLKLGNWREQPLDEVMAAVEATARENAVAPVGCERCSDLTRCRGGEITERVQRADGRSGRPPLCGVFQEGFARAEKILSSLSAPARKSTIVVETVS